MKKYVNLVIFNVLMLVIMFTNTFDSYASTDIPISVFVNGKLVVADVDSFILNSTTYVPIRAISEYLGIDEVYWDAEERSILLQDEELEIKMYIDEKVAYINRQSIYLENAPIISNGRTMVPVRFIAENLNCNVEWDKITYSVIITKDNFEVPAINIADTNSLYTKDDILWLSRIVHVEGLNLSLNGKLAIANVVLNRKKSSRFPNTVHDVIFQKDVHVQFPPAHKSGFTDLIPSYESVLAAKLALNGQNNISNCLFFNNAPFSSKANDLYIIIEGEYFYH